MAGRDFIKSQLIMLEDGFGAKNGFTAVQVELIENELSRLYIENSDVENAVFYLIKTKQGRQPLPSVETICAETERQRNDRLSSEKFKLQEHPLKAAEKRLTSKLHLLHCKCLIEKIKTSIQTAREHDTPEAHAFEKICKSKLEEVDLSAVTHQEVNEFAANAPFALQTEYQIIARAARAAVENDPFAED